MIVGDDPEDDPDDPGVSDNPLMITTTSSGVLRVKSPTDINTKKRSLDSSDLNESGLIKKSKLIQITSMIKLF